MRTRITRLSPEDAQKTLDIAVEADLAKSGVLDEERARRALKAQVLHARDIAERYDLDDEEDFEIDAVYGAVYEPKD